MTFERKNYVFFIVCILVGGVVYDMMAFKNKNGTYKIEPLFLLRKEECI